MNSAVVAGAALVLSIAWSVVLVRWSRRERYVPAQPWHKVVEWDNPDKPYKQRCACGEWWYDFDEHLRRVGQ